MISAEEVRTRLSGYPEPILQHYEAFLKTGQEEELNDFVMGLLQFLQDAGDAVPESAFPDEASLRSDLGVDSITIAEVIFQLEDILEIEIDNKDLESIQTVGDLRKYIVRKVSGN